LLKVVNSAAFAIKVPITSFTQAISLLGRRQLQRWLQLLLYARQNDDGVANPLLPLAALRGAHMEALCKLQGGERDAQDQAFMTGVFSLLDVLLATPMQDIVGALSLAPDAADALLRRGGPLGELLALAETAAPRLQQLGSAGIDPAQWWSSQLDAYHWAIQVSRNL
jgi:EAL and modified HD-GYP domain-containing signal transduction protein